MLPIYNSNDGVSWSTGTVSTRRQNNQRLQVADKNISLSMKIKEEKKISQLVSLRTVGMLKVNGVLDGR